MIVIMCKTKSPKLISSFGHNPGPKRLNMPSRTDAPGCNAACRCDIVIDRVFGDHVMRIQVVKHDHSNTSI